MTRRVGIVGAGIAGLALATLLARDGWDVEVLEQSPVLSPVGAGFLLQHLGQEVTHRLGIGDDLRAASSPVRRVDGRTLAGVPTLQLDYDDAVLGAEAWGVHRGTLFTLLHGAATGAGARITAGCEITATRRDGLRWDVTDRSGQVHGPYDLLVAADGSASRLRGMEWVSRFDRPYAWGALWTIVADPDGLNGDTLVQRWGDTRTTLGLMPTGGDRTSIFWSVRTRDLPAATAAGPQPWIERVAPLAGAYAPLVESTTALLPARYRDVVVRTPVGPRAVLIGDAAHAMSPQLGIGASMGLADVWTLAWALRRGDVQSGIEEYAAQRRRHVAFYRWTSMLLTPVFQSGLTAIAPPRDAGLRVGVRSALVRRQLVTLMMGARSSPWGRWALPSDA